MMLVTLGLYSIVWLAKRRDELMRHHHAKIPHWMWLVAPWIIVVYILIPLMVVEVMFFYSSSSTSSPALWVGLALATIAYAIGIWWARQFSAAMEKVISKRVTVMWSILYWLFWGPVIVFIWQFYINRIDTRLSPQKKPGPTKRFVVIGIIASLVGVVSTVMSFYSTFQDISSADTYLNETQQTSESFNIK